MSGWVKIQFSFMVWTHVGLGHMLSYWCKTYKSSLCLLAVLSFELICPFQSYWCPSIIFRGWTVFTHAFPGVRWRQGKICSQPQRRFVSVHFSFYFPFVPESCLQIGVTISYLYLAVLRLLALTEWCLFQNWQHCSFPSV